MANEHGGNWPDSGTGDSISGDHRRVQALCRQLFREMVKHDIQDRPLTQQRRRLLMRYGESLGLDPLESLLIVRGVEHETGQANPADLDVPIGAAKTEYLAAIDSRQGTFLTASVLLIGILLGLVGLWTR